VLYFIILFSIVVADQLTKYLIVGTFMLYESYEVVPGFFNLIYTINPGAAFSLLADVDSVWRHIFFVVVGLGAVVGLTIYHFKTSLKSRTYTIALSLICGGAMGNLIDRVRLGHVIDFLDFYYRSYHYPAFNVADSAICVGVGLFLLVNFSQIKDERTDNVQA